MKVLVTGHKGYVGSALVPKLSDTSGIDIITGQDIRNKETITEALNGCDAVIHLACLSNDPTADLDPELTRSINYDSMRPFVKAAKDAGVKRFIYASSSSVYGVKDEPNVTEELPLKPLTDYSKYKAMCEKVLLEEREPGFEVVIVRPATVCGYAHSLRLDLCVHILTMAALRRGTITVYGGMQYRPNIHIADICDAYIRLLEAPAEKVDGQIFNVCHRNLTIMETAELIASIIPAEIVTKPLLNDPRSYHVCGDKFDRLVGLGRPYHSIESAILSLKEAWDEGRIPNPDDSRYYRVRQIKEMNLA